MATWTALKRKITARYAAAIKQFNRVEKKFRRR